jgi:hypothetical protein
MTQTIADRVPAHDLAAAHGVHPGPSDAGRRHSTARWYPARIRPFAELAVAAAVALVVTAPAGAAGPATVPNPEIARGAVLLQNQGSCTGACNCYWSSDCGSGQTCGGYFSCTQSGKLDGTCRSSGSGGGWDLPDLTLAAEGIAEYFQVFEISAGDITGRTTLPKALAQLGRVQARRLTLAGHLAVQELALDALDLTVGFDLVRPRMQLCSAPVPTFRGRLAEAETALVHAVRDGLVAAVKSGDAGKIEAPLRSFWQKHPDFEPDHTGRCYDHGHRDFPYKTPLECQLTELRALLKLYLPTGGRYGN